MMVDLKFSAHGLHNSKFRGVDLKFGIKLSNVEIWKIWYWISWESVEAFKFYEN